MYNSANKENIKKTSHVKMSRSLSLFRVYVTHSFS